MIDLTTATPLEEAVRSLGRRSPLGVALSSAELESLPVELRDASFFSAQVESERLLAEMQRRILQRVKLERDKAAAGGRVMERARFISELQGELEDLGYVPPENREGSLQDLSSAGRLGLIWDMNLAMAEGHARWKTGMDPDILDAFPAQELVRDFPRRERRDWPRIWAENGGQFYGEPGPDYPSAPGRMIALKTDPIWTAISRFGTPWPPFDWGSGMGLRDVRRREAEALGLIGEDEELAPLDTPFTAGVSASLIGLPAESIERLRNTLGDAARIDREAGRITFTGPQDRQGEESISENLERRSREIADALRDAGEDRPEVLASLAAVATGRRELALVPASAEIPEGLETVPAADLFRVFRPDLTSRETVMRAGTTEVLRMVGMAGPDEPSTLVRFHGPEGDAFEILVPAIAPLLWAGLWHRDLSLALPGIWTFLVGKEVAG